MCCIIKRNPAYLSQSGETSSLSTKRNSINELNRSALHPEYDHIAYKKTSLLSSEVFNFSIFDITLKKTEIAL